MKTRLSLALLLLLLPFSFLNAKAQAAVELVSSEASYQFGEQITISAELRGPQNLREVQVLLETQAGDFLDTLPATLIPGEDTTRVLVVYQLQENPLRAFSRVMYRFHVILANGEETTLDGGEFFYEDNRFEWKALEEPPFNIHWYEGDIDLAREVLSVARSGLQRIQDLAATPAPESVDFYIYSNSEDMQGSLRLFNRSWIAGHADPDLGVAVITLPDRPDRRLIMEQRVPHELMHILLYQSLGPGYNNLPTWLNEGLASAAELYPNPDYQILLNRAHEEQRLLPIASLCQNFPRDASGALLAYAQAASFTRFLQRQFGASSLQELLTGYGDGLDCERGVEVVFGQSLNRLERQWRQETFSENALMIAANNLLPWFVLLLAVIAAPLLLTIRRLTARPAAQNEGSPGRFSNARSASNGKR